MAAHSQVHFLEANSASFLGAKRFVWNKGDPDQFAAHVMWLPFFAGTGRL
jgi:hypothetical protein